MFTSGCGWGFSGGGGGGGENVVGRGGGKRPCSLSSEDLMVELEGNRLDDVAILDDVKDGVLPLLYPLVWKPEAMLLRVKGIRACSVASIPRIYPSVRVSRYCACT